jgi:NAD(P)-dependent dehydrogenase (short-subunit alcohol dehydrogenase family)
MAPRRAHPQDPSEFGRISCCKETRTMDLGLAGKRIVISAGAGGIGRVTAELFLAEGARVFVCDVDRDALAALEGHHPALSATYADVSDSAQVGAFYDQVEAAVDGVDVLINNAGVSGPTKMVDDITDAEWAQTIGVNVDGLFFMARRAARLMKRQNGGVIINMSSTAGRLGMPLRSPYSTSKYAVRGLTDSLAVELGQYNIRVNAIMPGLVNGPRGRRVMEEQAAARGLTFDQYIPNVLHNISMHSMVEMREVADMALFLASDRAPHVSGQSIGVCGNFESYRSPR